MVLFNAPKQTPSSNAGVSLGGRAESGIGQGVDLILPRFGLQIQPKTRPGTSRQPTRDDDVRLPAAPGTWRAGWI